MCGRFTLAYEDWGEMLDYFGVENADFHQPPRYNVAPGQELAAVIAAPVGRRIGLLQWGLVPRFATRSQAPIKSINARLETVSTKPMFRSLVARRRCLIPADGFYEWKKSGTAKEPYRIVLKQRPFFSFAGLYDTWVNEAGQRVSSCLILTTTPNSLMKPIHDRMPVILSREAEFVWLDSQIQDAEAVCSLLGPYPADEMQAYRVHPMVGNVRTDVPECISPLHPLA